VGGDADEHGRAFRSARPPDGCWIVIDATRIVILSVSPRSLGINCTFPVNSPLNGCLSAFDRLQLGVDGVDVTHARIGGRARL